MTEYRNKTMFDDTMSFKGIINISSDFPATPENGWVYKIGENEVTDNDASKTNTGQVFSPFSGIVWDSTKIQWTPIQIVNAEYADERWTCEVLGTDYKFTLPNPYKPEITFEGTYELNT